MTIIKRLWQAGLAIFLISIPITFMSSSAALTIRIVGVVIFGIGLILLLIHGVTVGGKRKCPECASLIPREATVCRHCGHRFTPETSRAAQPES